MEEEKNNLEDTQKSSARSKLKEYVCHAAIGREGEEKLNYLVRQTGESPSYVVRQLIRGAKLCPRLSDKELDALDAMLRIDRNLVEFANALNGYAKNMTESARAKFILNGKTLEEWSKVVGEATEDIKKFKEKLKTK